MKKLVILIIVSMFTSCISNMDEINNMQKPVTFEGKESRFFKCIYIKDAKGKFHEYIVDTSFETFLYENYRHGDTIK